MLAAGRGSPMTPAACAVVMARRPRPGAVKTRLAAGLGETTACLLYEAFLADTLAACGEASAVTMVACSPRAELPWFRRFAPGALLIAQPEGSFGERLEASMRAAFEAGFTRVAVLGSDVPHLGAGTIDGALAAAGPGRAALVPTVDGGYGLLALGSPEPRLFQDIEWSSGRELGQTVQRVRQLGLELVMLPETFDIDTVADLRRLTRALARGEARCPRTAAVLARFASAPGVGLAS